MMRTKELISWVFLLIPIVLYKLLKILIIKFKFKMVVRVLLMGMCARSGWNFVKSNLVMKLTKFINLFYNTVATHNLIGSVKVFPYIKKRKIVEFRYQSVT